MGEVGNSGAKKSEFDVCGKLGQLDQRLAGVLADNPVEKGRKGLEWAWPQAIRVT